MHLICLITPSIHKQEQDQEEHDVEEVDAPQETSKKRKRGKRTKNKPPKEQLVITGVGEAGEPLGPKPVPARWSNTVGILVREWMEPSIKTWKLVPEAIKNHLWTELQKSFRYPQDMDEKTTEKARAYALQ
jgi:hypothetical protein